EAEMPGERLDQLVVVRVTPVPAADGAARERKTRVHDDAGRVEELLQPEAAARAARAVRVVEGKEPRLELGQAVAADRACEPVRELQRLTLRLVVEREPGSALGERKRRLERF